MKTVLWIAGIYAGYCLLLFLMQRQMIYPRGMIEPAAGGSGRVPGLEKIWIETDYGKIETWYLPPDPLPKGSPSAVHIFAHGNAELIDD